jgi:hypothetical protein
MTNLLIPFECPICGSDGFSQVAVKGRDGATRLTQAYECGGLLDNVQGTRAMVIGADGVDLKPALEKKRSI